MKKIDILTLELYTQVLFALDKYLFFKKKVENTVFAIQHIGNRKSFTEVLFPRDQTYPFAYSCGFTLNISYKKWHNWSRGGGGLGDDVKMLKNNLL